MLEKNNRKQKAKFGYSILLVILWACVTFWFTFGSILPGIEQAASQTTANTIAIVFIIYMGVSLLIIKFWKNIFDISIEYIFNSEEEDSDAR